MTMRALPAVRLRSLPVFLTTLFCAGLIGVALSLATASCAGARRRVLSRDLVPLAEATARIDAAMSAMDGAVRAYTLAPREETLAPYRDGKAQAEQALQAARPAAARLSGSLPARLDAVATATATWEGSAAEPRVAEARAAADAGLSARYNSLLDAYTGAYGPLTAEVHRRDSSARAELQTAERLQSCALWGTIAAAALLALLLAGLAARAGLRRLATLRRAARSGQATRRLMDGLRDAVLVIDPATLRLRDANPAAEMLSGRSREQLLALTPDELKSAAGVRGAVAAALAAGTSTAAYRYTWVQHSGVRVPLEGLNSIAAPDDDPMLIAVLRDIRGRLEAEQELGDSRDQLEAILQGVADGIIVQETSGEVTYANETAARILGYASAEAIVGQIVDRPTREFDVLDEAGRPFPLEQMPIRRVLRGEPEVEAVLRYRGRGSVREERWVTFRSSAVQRGDGQPKFVLSILHDLTALMRTQEEWRRSRDQLAAILQSVAEGITVLDPTRRLVYANAAAARILGVEAAETMLQHTDGELWRPFLLLDESGAPLPQERLPWEQALRGEQASETLVRLRPRAGADESAECWLVLKSTPILGDQGTVQFAVNVLQDITQRRRAEQLERQALHDELTGLPNRRLVDDRLQQAIFAARRNNTSLALLFLDLNKFKDVNDTYGHQAGDELLQQVGTRLQSSLRKSDTVARLGGDEFTMILPGARAPGATAAAEKIAQMLEQPFDVAGHRVTVGASIGIAFYPEDATDAATLTRRADSAMYIAKRSGGGYAVYTAELDDDATPTAAPAEPSRLSA